MNQKWDPSLYKGKHSFVWEYGKDLMSLLDPKPNESILDLGCGTGELTFEISKLAKKVIGIDKSSQMIADARRKFPNIDFRISDASQFSFDEKFDSIFSNATLHWVKNYQGAIKSMYLNLKENSKIVLELGGKGNIDGIIKILKQTLQKKGYTKQADMNLWYFPSIGEYTSELEKVGFRVIMAQHFDRITDLKDNKKGLIDWLSMFANHFFKDMGTEEAEQIKKEVQNKLKSTHFKNGKFFADYKRLRIVAIKQSY